MKSKLASILCITLLSICITSIVWGVKYHQIQNELNATNKELAEFKLSTLPVIEKNTSIKSTDEYFDYVMQDTFVQNYKLKLDSDVKINYRDFKTQELPSAQKYGTEFSIAYIEKDGSGKHVVYFAVPFTEGPSIQTVKYMFVTIEEISANLPAPAKGSFVKVS